MMEKEDNCQFGRELTGKNRQVRQDKQVITTPFHM